MSNKVTDRARVYVRFCCHFSLAGAWYPLPVLVTFFYSSQSFTPVKEADRLTFEGDGGGRYGWFQEKIIFCRLISREKNLARKCLAKKKIPTLKKKKILWRLLEKILHPCMSGKNYHQRFGKKFPRPSFQRQMVGPLVRSRLLLP